MKKLTMLLTFVFVLVQVSMFAQMNREYGPFRFVYDGMIGTGDEVKIEFIDTNQNKTINTFSMAENNPYNHLDFPVLETKKGYGPGYKTYQVGIEQLKNNELPVKLQNLTPEIESQPFVLMWSFHSIDIFEDTTLIIRYDLTIGGFDMMWATCATFFILDRYGNIISILDNLNRNELFDFAVTGQRYFVCTYYPSQLGISKNPGYLAYDLQSNELIDQQEFEGNYSAIGVKGYNGLISLGVGYYNLSEDVIYFDFNANKKYSKFIDANTLSSIRETNTDGIIYLNNGGKDTLFFHRDFKVEDIR